MAHSPTIWDPEEFCQLYSETPNVRKVAKALGVSAWSVYAFSSNNPWFRRRLEQARRNALEDIEDNLLTIARDGYRKIRTEDLTWEGVKTGQTKRTVERGVSLTAIIFALKGNVARYRGADGSDDAEEFATKVVEMVEAIRGTRPKKEGE